MKTRTKKEKMKKIKLSATNIGVGEKFTATIGIGVKYSFGIIPFSFMRADSDIITRTSCFFVFADDSVGVTEPLKVISNPTPTYFNFNSSINNALNFTCVNRELFVENRTAIIRLLRIMLY